MECLITCLLFTIMILPASYKDPVKQLYNYPPQIIDRVKSLPQYQGKIPQNQSKWLAKISGSILFILILSAVAYVSHARTFTYAFLYTYGIWNVVNWYDAFVLDIAIFAHVKHFRLPGTEDMVSAYTHPWFYIQGALKGMLIGLVVCILSAGLVSLVVTL